MGYLKYIRDLWKKPKKNMDQIWFEKMVEFRSQPTTLRIEHPTRLDRARSLGYRAKQGFIVVRQRINRGGFRHPDIKGGRRPKRNSPRMALNKSYQRICEERVAKHYTNCEVLNSYYAGEDGQHLWYEVILIDKNHPQILKDQLVKGVAKQTGRVYRGLTSAGKKSRGLRSKGKGAEKVRPTQKAHRNRLH